MGMNKQDHGRRSSMEKETVSIETQGQGFSQAAELADTPHGKYQ